MWSCPRHAPRRSCAAGHNRLRGCVVSEAACTTRRAPRETAPDRFAPEGTSHDLSKPQSLRRKLNRSFADISDAALETKLATAQTCYEAWRLRSYAERAAIIAKASTLLHAQADAFARIMTLEMGKRIAEARGEAEFSARILAYYAENAARFLAPTKLSPTVGEAHMESSPIGVIFCVEPWNFPYYQLARIAGPHLMAGNTLVVKHAAIVPGCAIAFEKLLTDAGAPAGLYTNLLISHEQSDQIIDDPRIKGVALTGSVAAGQSIAARAGRTSRSRRWSSAAATPSSCSTMPISRIPCLGRCGGGCTIPARPVARPSASSSSSRSPMRSSPSSRRGSKR